MIYLKYVYAKSGLPEPSRVALFVEDNDWLNNEVSSEFATLFSTSGIVLASPQDTIPSADLMVLVYRKAPHHLKDRLDWGRRQSSYARLALGFYCVDQRRFELVIPREFNRWARRQQLVAWMTRWFQECPTLLRLFEMGLSRCAF